MINILLNPMTYIVLFLSPIIISIIFLISNMYINNLEISKIDFRIGKKKFRYEKRI